MQQQKQITNVTPRMTNDGEWQIRIENIYIAVLLAVAEWETAYCVTK